MSGSSNIKELSRNLQKLLIKNGASAIGYGDLSGIPGDKQKSFSTGISIAVALTPSIVKGTENGHTIEYYEEYKRINKLLDKLALLAENYLKNLGFKASAQLTTVVVEDEGTYRTDLPYKAVATRAGLVWIGNCALLVTEQFGSAIRITSVLTDAGLETSKPINESKCGNCKVCKNNCPGKAVSGKNWRLGVDRDEFFDAFACRKTARERSVKVGIDASMCWLCILKCPWTQKYLHK